MSNIRFYYDNLFDKLSSAAISATTEVSTLPVENLQHPLRTCVWRSTGVVSQSVSWDLGVSDTVRYVALVDHNISAYGEIRVTASANADYSSPAYDVTVDAWEPLVGFGEYGFGEFGFGGYATDDMLAELSSGTVRVMDLGEDVTVRYWRVTIDDPYNPSGYVQAGRLFCGRYWEPADQFEFDWDLTPLDESTVYYSEGGQAWTDQVEKRWEVKIDLALIRNEERYWRVADMFRRMGVRSDFIVSLWPDASPSQKYFTTLYGRLDRVPPLSQQSAVYSGAKIVFRESL